MPKKTTKKHVKETGITRSHGSNPAGPAGIGTVKVKHFRSVRIGVSNGRRWLSLKKRLGLPTDDDLAVYLLDLAESIARQDSKIPEEEWRKPQRDQQQEESKILDVKVNVLADNSEEPLRRSPRKQGFVSSPSDVPEVPSKDSMIQEQKLDERTLLKNDVKYGPKTKHHRKSTRISKHRKDKRKRRKHVRSELKNGGDDDETEKCQQNVERENNFALEKECVTNNICIESKLIDKNSKITLEECTVTLTKIDEEHRAIKATKTENVDNVEYIKDLENNEKENEKKEEEEVLSHRQNDNCNNISTVIREETNNSLDNLDDSLGNNHRDKDNTDNQNIENKSTEHFDTENNDTNKDEPSVLDTTYDFNEDDETEDNDDRKFKKKRRKLKNDYTESEENIQSFQEANYESTMAQLSDQENNVNIVSTIMEKQHRKRKHKHVSEHKIKKHHDGRKAPQDGIVTEEIEPSVTTNETHSGSHEISNDIGNGDDKMYNDNNLESGLMTEPQRLAIKIKLCQDCNTRHLQDTCPLTIPQYLINDALTYEEWLNKHNENLEVLKAVSNDEPMSVGYGRFVDDGFESEEESLSTEQSYRSKHVKIQCEEKQLLIEPDRPLYSRESLPDCLELKMSSSTEHGLGVFAKDPMPIYAKLGPLVGKPVREMDIPDDFSMRHIWEVENNGKTAYLSTTDPLRSNWIRYMRPAVTKEERSVAVITKEAEVFLVTTKNISIGMELTYWADSQSSAWTRKNKIDKTNCGGCNLNFAHPIYYRLHCCIFHDTNYSLTIRKYHCKVCGASVLGKDNIMKHAAELHAGRGAYQCQYCKKFFLRLNYLEMHRTYGCSQNPQRSRPLCDFCGREFCQPQKLKVHIKRMHSDMSEVLREFQCKLCLKLLGSRAALQRHMKEVHHKDVVGAATCDRCGKMFQNKSNLKIHMLTHSGVKPFKCKESTCKAAFTTKQCLQFHYKKVHGMSEEMMPKIERSVAYTFDAYSGGLVEDVGRGKIPRMNRRSSQQDNSNSLPSLDDCCSENSMKAEVHANVTTTTHPATMEFQNGMNLGLKLKSERELRVSPPPLPLPPPVLQQLQQQPQQQQQHQQHQQLNMSTMDPGLENVRSEIDIYGPSRLQSKGSKKWMGEFNPRICDLGPTTTHLTTPMNSSEVYEFDERKDDDEDEQDEQEDEGDKVPTTTTQNTPSLEDTKLGLSVYRRTESSNASLLVEAALDAAERDIGAVSSSPILEDNDRDGNLYSISTQLQSPISQRSPETTHLDSYIHQQDELMSPAPTPDNRHTPPNHIHVDYHLHRPIDYVNSTGVRTHNIEQYLHHEDLTRVSSPNYIHGQQEELISPSVTPNSRYQDLQQQQQQQHHHHHHHHHHQVPTDNLSSDEGDSVAQNLSLSVKEKNLQLDSSSNPYKYDTLETDFIRERNNFEPLVVNNGELQGLDMSARGFHHTFGSMQIQNTRYGGHNHHHHHHHHHLYDIPERQSVDLSRTGGYTMSLSPPPPPSVVPPPPPPAPPPPPPYPHSDVLRVVSLDLTPGGRHSVDLSLARSSTHHLHGTGTRIISSSSPQNVGSATPHVVPDTLEGRILSSSPPVPSVPQPVPGYNTSYALSPASSYHPSTRTGYHHYPGYY